MLVLRLHRCRQGPRRSAQQGLEHAPSHTGVVAVDVSDTSSMPLQVDALSAK